MSATTEQKRFSEHDKAAIVAEMIATGLVTDTARKHGVSSATLYNWRNRYPKGVVEELEPEQIIGSAVGARRFPVSDLDMPFGQWVVGRLVETFPGRTALQIKGWLAAMSGSNEALFLRTDRAVILALIAVPPLAEAVIEIKFSWYTEGGKAECMDLHLNLYRWAKDLRATEISLGVLSDLSAHDLVKMEPYARPLMLEKAVVKVR